MTAGRSPGVTLAVVQYEICVQGALDSDWSSWFDGFLITSEVIGVTTMAGEVTDQAALHALLTRVRDLGLTLLSVRQVEIAATRRAEQNRPL